MLPYMRQFNQIQEPPQLKSYLKRQLEDQYRIAPGKTVAFKRDGYSFTNGVVDTLHVSINAALVTWQDERGWTHQAVCGLEYLRRTETPTVKTIGAL